jgi:hypothetical protein
MGKSILYSLFGFGKLPKAMVPVLQGEGIVLMEEGVPGSVTLRKFRAPGRIHSYKRSGFSGSIVITELRFAAFAFSRPIINVPTNDERIGLLDLSVSKEGVLCVKFNAGDFHEGWKGTVECRFSTPSARLFLERLKSNDA